ncbi:hypothetical protein LSAT2_024406 [Lamellibrachia satsuma]|nr:hypothetical protein LSAT2_024406 [Lamellibrachia satsuma]
MSSGFRLRLPLRLDHVCIVWFWLTMCSFTAIGIVHVFPVVYADTSVSSFTWHHVIVYVTFFEVAVNWLCIRLVESTFRPADHASQHSGVDVKVSSGYEINWNHLKKGPEAGKYALPVSSMKPINGLGHADELTSRTVYVVEMTADELGVDGDCSEGRRRYVCPYWAWNPCRPCRLDRPPRAHHCPVCRACVLKRDHHCAFTGTCVGVRNQRHFVVFTFWVALATLYSLAHALWYGIVDFLPRNSPYDLLLPLTLLRWGFGRVAAFDVVLVALFYSLVFFFFFSLVLFVNQMALVVEGLTSFESSNDVKVKVAASTSENIRGVFGDYWLYNFVVPLHNIFPGADNGVTWAKVKV